MTDYPFLVEAVVISVMDETQSFQWKDGEESSGVTVAVKHSSSVFSDEKIAATSTLMETRGLNVIGTNVSERSQTKHKKHDVLFSWNWNSKGHGSCEARQ